MILARQHIPTSIVTPFIAEKCVHAETGMSYGLSAAGYDIRVAQKTRMEPGKFWLASSLERFNMPGDVLGEVKDKSSLARQGISVFNTCIEPGWFGFLTLEIKNLGHDPVEILCDQPIAQILFYRLSAPTDRPYAGKYQDQPNRPVAAIREAAE